MRRTMLCLATVLAAFAVPAHALDGPIAQLEPLLGTWVIEDEWASGESLWARAEYEEGIAGRTIEARIFVRDDGGELYQRYFTVFRHDAERDALVAHSFPRDGSHRVQVYDFENGVLSSEWDEGATTIRDQVAFAADGRLHWIVRVRADGEDEFQTVMDGHWERVEDQLKETTMRRPIDAATFAASGPAVRHFVKTATIAAPVERVYAAWTDPDVFPTSYDPANERLSANIELAIGGPFEWLWDGKLGSNGCQILSYIPNRMVSFSWNAPPSQPESRAKRTWVVVEFEPTEAGATELTLTHLGFGEAEHWDETHDYFAKAWPYVLDKFRENLEGQSR